MGRLALEELQSHSQRLLLELRRPLRWVVQAALEEHRRSEPISASVAVVAAPAQPASPPTLAEPLAVRRQRLSSDQQRLRALLGPGLRTAVHPQVRLLQPMRNSLTGQRHLALAPLGVPELDLADRLVPLGQVALPAPLESSAAEVLEGERAWQWE